MASKRKALVIGAGAFGGWTAWSLLRKGVEVTVLDAWGPGNSRASSGGETRLIRSIYGGQSIYSRMAARSLALWRESEAALGFKAYHQTGLVWLATHADCSFEIESLKVAREEATNVYELDVSEARRRYPQINLDDARMVLFEPDAGILSARQACAAVLNAVVAAGGAYFEAWALPGQIAGDTMQKAVLSNRSAVQADFYVFALGPWLGYVFPEVIGDLIAPTRQEVFFFGTPPGDAWFTNPAMPAWVDRGDRFVYGMPDNFSRGFKIADDTRGIRFDPTGGSREITAEGLRFARAYLENRFPRLRGAPLVDARVCQYENTPDHNLIIDFHPAARNVLLVGGGSGHGFKHGPAVGEVAAGLLLDGAAVEPFFSLARFSPRTQS